MTLFLTLALLVPQDTPKPCGGVWSSPVTALSATVQIQKKKKKPVPKISAVGIGFGGLGGFGGFGGGLGVGVGGGRLSARIGARVHRGGGNQPTYRAAALARATAPSAFGSGSSASAIAHADETALSASRKSADGSDAADSERDAADRIAPVVFHLDPDFAELGRRFDALLPSPAATPSRRIDVERLRRWFDAIDESHDDRIALTEWRARTGLSPEFFHRVDTSRDGFVGLDEFARAMVGSALAGDCPVDPALLAWTHNESPSTPTPPTAAPSSPRLAAVHFGRRVRN